MVAERWSISGVPVRPKFTPAAALVVYVKMLSALGNQLTHVVTFLTDDVICIRQIAYKQPATKGSETRQIASASCFDSCFSGYPARILS